MTTDERLEKVERELARAKRRNRWLLATVGLAVGTCLLTWAITATPSTARAQAGGQDSKQFPSGRYQICAMSDYCVFVIEQETGNMYQLLSRASATRHDVELSKNNPNFQFVWRPVAAGPPK